MPVFFVGIGLQTTGVDDTKMIVFIAIMTVLGVITKVVGCGLGGRMAGFGGASALMIGAGMVPRGEMALITAQIGFNEHVLGSEYYDRLHHFAGDAGRAAAGQADDGRCRGVGGWRCRYGWR